MQLANWKHLFPRDAACPIWGTRAGMGDAASAPDTLFSPRAGGAFVVADADALRGALQEQTPAQKMNLRRALSNWVTENQMRGGTAEFSAETVSQIRNLAAADPRRATGDALSVRERGDRLLLLLDALAADLSQPVHIDEDCRNLALAWSATKNRKALWFILRDLERQSCIDLESRVSAEGPQQFATVQGEGLKRVESMRQVLHAPAAEVVFAAMWGGAGSAALFEEAIAPAVSANGLRAARLPRETLGNRPVGESLAAIRGSRMVIVEMTGDPGEMAPGGLWFEAGFAAGCGVPVLWTCRDDEALRSALSLDLESAPSGFLFWKTTEELRDGLTERIGVLLAGGGPMTVDGDD